MGSISLLQWRKAYMLEFLDGDDLVECFTFSVPPESEEFDFPQRITETKTFGGSVFDDYGNDTYRITLSGTTVNEEKKLIYKGKVGAPMYLTGTKEIFELQKIIKNWADGKAMKKGSFFRKSADLINTQNDRKVYLYDLSKMSILQLATGAASRNYWRVFIKDLKIKRDKSKPKTYNYTLEMVAVEDNEKAASGLFSDLADAVKGITDFMDCANSVMELTEATVAATAEVADCCNKVKNAFQMTKNRKYDAGLVALAVGNGVDAVSRIFGGDSDSFYNTTKELLHAVSGFGALAKGENASGVKQRGSISNTDRFVVTFNSDGGTNIKSQTIEYGKYVDEPDAPTKADFSFAGWFSDSELVTAYDFSQEVTKNMTLYAKWNLATATVTFNSRNGSYVAPQKVTVGEKARVPAPPTRNGYAFDKWCTDYAGETAFDFDTPITDNTVLYAAWRQTCKVVFNSNGGSEVKTQILNIGDLAVYPKTPTKDNYAFAYWCTDSGLQNVFNFSTQVISDITLYALWVRLSNTVTFDSRGGSAVSPQKVAIGGYASKPVTDPTKEGYDFVYWATDSEGTNEFRFSTTPVNQNMTLYAKWTESEYNVVFDSMGGSEIETQSVKYGKKAVFPEIPTKDSHSFEMWQTRREVEVDSGQVGEDNVPIMTTEYEYEEFDFNTEIRENMTLYAKWFG